jgi:hypothetical protein
MWSCLTCLAISGAYWMALPPVPMDTTVLPVMS